jgi:threonine aldolase
MHFLSDNAAGASPKILEAIIASSDGFASPYGQDNETARARGMLRDLFKCDLAAFFVASGTAANGLALGAIAPPWGAVLCHERAHVMQEECGAPEFFTGGAKLVGVRGDRGKITLDAFNDRLAAYQARPGGRSRPVALSLSQANECGAVYSVSEISALAARAHEEGLRVHMDGARFANALVALGAAPADMSWRAGVDVLSLGASKNGALACEAVIFFNPEHARDFALQRKRGGHSIAKGRFLGAQMCAWLEDGAWLETARHANWQAARLAAGLARAPGVRLAWPPEANLVFVALPRALDRELRAAGAEYYEWPPCAPFGKLAKGEIFARLATSFATTSEEVDRFIRIASRAAAPEILSQSI